MTGILGLVLVGAAVARVSRPTGLLLGPLALGIGVITGITVIVDAAALASPVATGNAAPLTTIGAGVLLTALGALAALVAGAGLLLHVRRSNLGPAHCTGPRDPNTIDAPMVMG